MKRLLAAVAALVLVGLATPRPAAAGFAVSVGGPGFGVFVGRPAGPVAPPIFTAPPPAYYIPYYYAPPAYVYGSVYGPSCYRQPYFRGGYYGARGYGFRGRY